MYVLLCYLEQPEIVLRQLDSDIMVLIAISSGMSLNIFLRSLDGAYISCRFYPTAGLSPPCKIVSSSSFNKSDCDVAQKTLRMSLSS